MRTFRAPVVFVFPVIVVIGGFTLGCRTEAPDAGSGPLVGFNESVGFEDTAGADSVSHRSDIGFLSPVQYNTGGEFFSDDVVDDLMGTLDELLARPETLEDFEGQANLHLWRYTTRLNKGYLTPAQDSRIVAHLGRLAVTHPEAAALFESSSFMVKNLMLGKEAPNIVGTDLDGVRFELSDYRGKVVAIVFSGHWCGPCRSEYPYQRLLLEVMDEEEFILLGVNSDGDLQVAKDAKVEEELDYLSWWDGHGEKSTDGPIATQWNVTGWPTIYVLDENGVIRNRGARHEKLITLAKELVAEMKKNRATVDQ